MLSSSSCADCTDYLSLSSIDRIGHLECIQGLYRRDSSKSLVVRQHWLCGITTIKTKALTCRGSK